MTTEQVEVTSADIARIAGVKPTAVSNWRRRHDDFPKPVGGTDRSPRFALAEVEDWLRSQGRSTAIPTAQRLGQAFDSVRDVMSAEDALGVVGVLLLHGRGRRDVSVPAEPDALARLLVRVGEKAIGPAANELADLVRPLARRDVTRLATFLASALEALDADDAGAVFELLCTRFLESGRPGFAAAPAQLADLMIRLAGPPAASLLDPACGSGTFLLAAATHGYQRVLGQEVAPALARLAALRLAFHRAVADVRTGDSLREPAFEGDGAAVVITHPPFNERNWGYDDLAHGTWEYGVPPRMESELAWVQRALASVTPGGTVVVLMPPAAAMRPSGRRIRRELITRGALQAVISLPPGLAAHYAVALQIWILRRPDDGGSRHVLVVDTTGDAPPGPTRKNPDAAWARVHELVTDAWEKFRADPSTFPDRLGVARAVPAVDLLDEDVDVTPRRYLPLPPPPGLSGHELDEARERLAQLLTALRKNLPDSFELPELDGEDVRSMALAELVKSGAVFIRRPSPPGTAGRAEEAEATVEARILTGRDITTGAPPSDVGDVDADELRNPPIREGDVLVPAITQRPTARVAASDDIGAYPAASVYVVRVDSAIVDPWYLAGYLSSSDGARQAERAGSSLSGAIRLDLRRVRIPLLPLATQQAYGAAFQRLSEFSRTLRTAHDLGQELARNSTDAIASTLSTDERSSVS